MSLMRTNYTIRELKEIGKVIHLIIDANTFIFSTKKPTTSDTKAKSSTEINHSNPEACEILDTAKNFARTQVELILFKHVALMETMIVEIFRHLAFNLAKSKVHQEKINRVRHFSNTDSSADYISELTDGHLNIKKMEYWGMYKTSKRIRNTIAHGAPAFTLISDEIDKLNSIARIVEKIAETNKCDLTSSDFPSLIHPTGEAGATWVCVASDNMKELVSLNSQFVEFAEQIRRDYLAFGVAKGFTNHQLYA